MDKIIIIPQQDEHIPGQAAALTSVAREGKYLSTNTGFSEESARMFTQDCHKQGFPQFVAVDTDKNIVVGWCDIVARPEHPRGVGFLGVGLLPDYRGRGIGTRLMLETIRAAEKSGFSTICLECRASNKNAIKVYKKMGFRTCFYNPFGLMLEGAVIPIIGMKAKISRIL